MIQDRPSSLTAIAALMIVFGLAEVATGFTHGFLGLISIAGVPRATYTGVAIGVSYAAGGCLLLTMKKWAARLAVFCLSVVIAGRVSMMLTGLYPMTSFLQSFSIVAGTLIAIFFATFVALKWPSFR